MKIPLSVLILAALSELVSALIREHVYVDKKLSWFDAQSYCRTYYNDLTTISREEEYLRFLNTTVNGRSGWIGLYKKEKAEYYSQWSDGNPITYTPRVENTTTGYDQCLYVHSSSWVIENCVKTFAFFCYTIPDLILVNEHKTWEEALEYCRENYIDLASLTSATDILIANKVVNTTAVTTWTSLRFLAGLWFWVNGEALDSQILLPSCPVFPNHCGGRNFHAGRWELRDCEEKLRFFCYSQKYSFISSTTDNNEDDNAQ